IARLERVRDQVQKLHGSTGELPPQRADSGRMRDVNKAIAEFCCYFEREIGEISRLVVTYENGAEEPSAASGPLYRKVLYVTMLDTLAGVRFHKSVSP